MAREKITNKIVQFWEEYPVVTQYDFLKKKKKIYVFKIVTDSYFLSRIFHFFLQIYRLTSFFV